ncbi:thioesterase family protein [Corynebacterium sp. USCH3]|uniref:thioesterase family protein n=1 Tax=Corynebacterium sp. USCH3 TaxID=3024840 RepID=UPI0030A25FEB
MSEYADVSAVTPCGDHLWTAEIDPGWTILGNPNGGYLQTIMARAAVADAEESTDEATHPHTVAASTHFLRSPRPGRVELTSELMRAGRTTTQVRVRMSQNGQITGESLFTLGTLTEADIDWSTRNLPDPGAPFADCTRFTPPREQFPVEIFHHAGLHLHPGQTALTEGKPRGLGEVRAWVELPDGEDFTPESLLLAADLLPPAPFDVKPGGWVPTIELSTYIRAVPVPGPVNVLLTANLIQGDRVDESATVWDSEGNLVAQSHQFAGIRFS